MTEFSIEELSEKIHYGKTKVYFKEVLSSYNNSNYRSAVVMLWSVAVCDIVYKLQYLVDLYGDANAKNILDEVTALQERDPRSSVWEIKLIDDAFGKTNLLDTSEHENIKYLQKQRHLSAHPVLNSERELHYPNKETVRALIKNTLEGVLVKPPFYTQKIINELLEDLEESAPVLNTYRKLKNFVKSRYLSRLTQEVEISIFRSLWKLVFRLEDEQCEKNRKINFQTLEVITNRNLGVIPKKIAGDKDYYSNIASVGTPLSYIVLFLSKYSSFYDILNEDAKLKIQHCIDVDDIGKICGWFVKKNLDEHYQNLLEWIESDSHPNFQEDQWDSLLKISDTEEWQNKFCCLTSAYYAKSDYFNEADERFSYAIAPFLRLFDRESIIFLLKRIEQNNQTYWRGRASLDHSKIMERIHEIFDDDFDLTSYPNFEKNVSDEED